jgi:hypothetical protein
MPLGQNTFERIYCPWAEAQTVRDLLADYTEQRI